MKEIFILFLLLFIATGVGLYLFVISTSYFISLLIIGVYGTALVSLLSRIHVALHKN